MGTSNAVCERCGRPLFEGRCLGTSTRPGCAPKTSPLKLAATADGERTAAITSLHGAIVRRAEDVEARRGFGTVLRPQPTMRSILGMREPVLRIAWDDGTEGRRALSTLSVATPEERRVREARRAGVLDRDRIAAWDPAEPVAERVPAWCGRCGAALVEGRCGRPGCAGPG